VEAVGVAHVTLTQLSTAIRGAMVSAVEAAQAEGVSDPTVIRQRMLEARATAIAAADG
jgi:hypothetical protein